MSEKSIRKQLGISSAGWILGFLLSYFILSTALYFVFFRHDSYLSGMLTAGVLYLCGTAIKRYLK